MEKGAGPTKRGRGHREGGGVVERGPGPMKRSGVTEKGRGQREGGGVMELWGAVMG